jgi:hypothetical protein
LAVSAFDHNAKHSARTGSVSPSIDILRFKRIAQDVFTEGSLRGQVRVPDAASDLSIELNIAAGLVRFGADLQAPQEGRQQTRINWLLKQLKDDRVPADLIVKVDWDRKGLRTLGKAGELRVNASGLMFDGHHQPVPPDAMPRRFLLEHTCKLDKPKGKCTTAVLKGISDDLEAFYGNVVEHLVGYVAPAPKLPKEPAATPPETMPIQPSASVATEPVATSEPEEQPNPTARSTDEATTTLGFDAVLAASGDELPPG